MPTKLKFIKEAKDKDTGVTFRYVPFGSRTQMPEFSNFYPATITVTIPEKKPFIACTPKWMRGRAFTTPSAEHMWHMLNILRGLYEYDEAKVEKITQTFGVDGRLSDWEELRTWPCKGGKVQDIMQKKKDHFKLIGIIPKLFMKLDPVDAKKKFGFRNDAVKFCTRGGGCVHKKEKQMKKFWSLILRAKFQDEKLGDLLKASGEVPLVEEVQFRGTADKAADECFWGGFVCRKEGPFQGKLLGRNFMGECLMHVRNKMFVEPGNDVEECAKSMHVEECEKSMHVNKPVVIVLEDD